MTIGGEGFSVLYLSEILPRSGFFMNVMTVFSLAIRH